ncbi:hypothetical protein JCM17960_29980 [Magnetospira thiophila]
MEKKLLRSIAFMVVVTLGGLLALLPYRLYEHDTAVAREHARMVSDELSNMIKLTMLTTKEAMIQDSKVGLEGVPAKIEELYARFSAGQTYRFRVIRSPLIEAQFSAVEGRQADRPQITQVLESGKPASLVDGVLLTYWSPIRADKECGYCHKDANRVHIREGETLGVVETVFDLTRQKERSIRTIVEITGFLMVMVFVMAYLIMTLIRKGLIRPIQALISALQRRQTDPDHPLPESASPEMAQLIAAIRAQGKKGG